VANKIDPALYNDPVFQRVLADAMAIQDRFSAEPTYGRDQARELIIPPVKKPDCNTVTGNVDDNGC
jgi:hypothetical protein